MSGTEATPTIKNYYSTTSSVAPGVSAWRIYLMKLRSLCLADRDPNSSVGPCPVPHMSSPNF